MRFNMMDFEAEPTREPLAAAQRAYNREMSSRMIVTPEVAAEIERLAPIARPGGVVMLDDPCACEICRIQQDVEATRDQIARIMAGVDMPGRIVDDVQPDQRGA